MFDIRLKHHLDKYSTPIRHTLDIDFGHQLNTRPLSGSFKRPPRCFVVPSCSRIWGSETMKQRYVVVEFYSYVSSMPPGLEPNVSGTVACVSSTLPGSPRSAPVAGTLGRGKTSSLRFPRPSWHTFSLPNHMFEVLPKLRFERVASSTMFSGMAFPARFQFQA